MGAGIRVKIVIVAVEDSLEEAISAWRDAKAVPEGGREMTIVKARVRTGMVRGI